MKFEKLISEGRPIYNMKHPLANVDVSIRYSNPKSSPDKITVYFRNGTNAFFKSQKVIPLVIRSKLYFLDASMCQEMAFGKGYQINRCGNRETYRIVITARGGVGALIPFVGEYSSLIKDEECDVYYIRKKCKSYNGKEETHEY